MTFYWSDIEFEDKHAQAPLLFATEDILLQFETKATESFSELPKMGRSKGIDCKGK
jgi:hypothetical protein